MARLAGKVCVITGTASGIGAESARLFAAEGATVVGIDLDAEQAVGGADHRRRRRRRGAGRSACEAAEGSAASMCC